MPPVFETVEHALYDVAGLVEVDIVFELHFAVLAGRNAGNSFSVFQPIAQVIGVISAISDDVATLADIGFKTLSCLGNIRPIARSQPEMNRASGAVANQM